MEKEETPVVVPVPVEIQQQPNHQTRNRVDDLEKYMNGRMEENLRLDGGYYPERQKDSSSSSLRPRIMKVPKAIRRGNEASYTPKFVSIGPIHRDLPELKRAEPVKWRHLHALIKRSPEHNSVGRYLAAVAERVGEARSYYKEFSSMSDDEFVKMLVLDGCFIIEFLIKEDVKWRSPPIWNLHEERQLLRHDLFLLENQIPFFVLQLLFDNTNNVPQPQFLVNNPLASSEWLKYYALNCVSTSWLIGRVLAVGLEFGEGEEIHHLMHLKQVSHVYDLYHLRSNRPVHKLRWYHPKRIWIYICRALDALILFVAFILVIWKIPLLMKKETTILPHFIPTAANLKEYGISITKKWHSNFVDYRIDVCFDEQTGRLEIPKLLLHENSISSMRNHMAFELCCLHPSEHYVTGYAILMHHLIDTAEDVAVLEKYGIIINEIGSREDVVNFFTEMGHICFGASIRWPIDLQDMTFFYRVRMGLKKHCESLKNRVRADLVTTFTQTYGRTPKRWILASIFGAVFILILTCIQTAYTVLSYYHH